MMSITANLAPNLETQDDGCRARRTSLGMAYRAQLDPHEGGLLYNSVEGIVEVPKWRHRMDSKALYLADIRGVVFDQHYCEQSVP